MVHRSYFARVFIQVEPTECPQGYYCEGNTGENKAACPRGTYGAKPGLQSIDGKQHVVNVTAGDP